MSLVLAAEVEGGSEPWRAGAGPRSPQVERRPRRSLRSSISATRKNIPLGRARIARPGAGSAAAPVPIQPSSAAGAAVFAGCGGDRPAGGAAGRGSAPRALRGRGQGARGGAEATRAVARVERETGAGPPGSRSIRWRSTCTSACPRKRFCGRWRERTCSGTCSPTPSRTMRRRSSSTGTTWTGPTG